MIMMLFLGEMQCELVNLKKLQELHELNVTPWISRNQRWNPLLRLMWGSASP